MPYVPWVHCISRLRRGALDVAEEFRALPPRDRAEHLCHMQDVLEAPEEALETRPCVSDALPGVYPFRHETRGRTEVIFALVWPPPDFARAVVVLYAGRVTQRPASLAEIAASRMALAFG